MIQKQLGCDPQLHPHRCFVRKHDGDDKPQARSNLCLLQDPHCRRLHPDRLFKPSCGEKEGRVKGCHLKRDSQKSGRSRGRRAVKAAPADQVSDKPLLELEVAFQRHQIVK